jgi:hypothetical protein
VKKNMATSSRLRTVEKHKPPYPLNKVPRNFAIDLGRDVVCLLVSRGKKARLEGSDWEDVFVRWVGAQRKPSNAELDDMVLEQTAWGAKTVKNRSLFSFSQTHLISGGNSPVYSFGDRKTSEVDPNPSGENFLAIWNERVAGIRKLYRHVRTVVLIKSDDLLELAAFEFETVIYPADQFWRQWNERNHLEGFNHSAVQPLFTWPPHGSPFTIVENEPEARLAIKIKEPPLLDREAVSQSVRVDDSWVHVL